MLARLDAAAAAGLALPVDLAGVVRQRWDLLAERAAARGLVAQLELAEAEVVKYASDDALDALHIAWAGGLEPGEGHYYRVHGPTLLAEYDNTQRGANHVHTVWRDPRHDFGVDALRAHYEHGHRH